MTVFQRARRHAAVGKYFARTVSARDALAAERLSHEVFQDRAWRMPILRWTRNGFLVPRLDNSLRLDVLSQRMTERERVDAGAWAVEVLLDIYLAGYFHGDLQPHNVWLLGDRLVVTDFETLRRRSDVPFLRSGDISGFDPQHDGKLDPAFDPADEWSFHGALGVRLEDALSAAREHLMVRGTPHARRCIEAMDMPSA